MQPLDGLDGVGKVIFAHQRDGIDTDALAPQVVPVRLVDSAYRDLGDLGAAADDDDT